MGGPCPSLQNGDMDNELTDGADEEEDPMIIFRESHMYGDLVEAQYYASEGVIEKERRVSTNHICCHCYTDSHLENNKDVEARKDR